MRTLARRWAALAVVVALVLVGQPATALVVPHQVHRPMPPVAPPPAVTAESWILYDDTYGIVLAAHEADTPRPMASTTKIMTAIVALEHETPGQEVTVSERAAAVGEAEIGLVAGERLPVDQLITAFLVRSANDAAMAVAEAIGGTVEGFVRLMNEEAERLGLEHTAFVNPHGLDAPGHHTTARELLEMSLAAMSLPTFPERVATERFRIPDAPDGTVRVAETTNLLLDEYPGAIGVKTGYTSKAGLVLVAAAERDGRRLYAVVMGSDGPRAHFRDATALLDHGFADYGIVPLVLSDTPLVLANDVGPELVRREADVRTLVHLASRGLLGVPIPAPEPAPAAPTTPETPTTVEPSAGEPAPALPGLDAAFRWFFGGDGGTR